MFLRVQMARGGAETGGAFGNLTNAFKCFQGSFNRPVELKIQIFLMSLKDS